MAELAFNAESHTYTLDGRALPSVTQVLDPLNELDGVPRDVLAAATEFGTHVHLACDLHDVQDVYILEHRNCGAYEKLLGKEGEFGTSENEQKRERLVHKKHADKLKKDIEKWAHEKGYKLNVQTFLMDLRGGVDFLGK